MATGLSDKSTTLLEQWSDLHGRADQARTAHESALADLHDATLTEGETADVLIQAQAAALVKAREALESVQADLGLSGTPPAPAADPAPREDDGTY